MQGVLSANKVSTIFFTPKTLVLPVLAYPPSPPLRTFQVHTKSRAMASANLEALEAALARLNNAAAVVRSWMTQPTAEDDELAASYGLAGSITIPHDSPTRLQNSKNDILEATTTIQQLLTSPNDFQRQQANANQVAACMRWLCYFDIPSLIPETTDGISLPELASVAGVPELTLTRVCLAATTAGFLHCPRPGILRHTPLSLGYRGHTPVLDSMLFLTETNMPTAYHMVEMTLSQLSDTDEPKTAFQIAHGTDLGFFPYLSQNPTIAKRLANGMRDISAAGETHIRHLVNGYDWAGLNNANVVDIGGSLGHASMALAKAFPDLEFTVQDLPPVIAQAGKQKLDESIASRIKFEVHNFHTAQPPSTADAKIFLIRQCLQNHPHNVAVTMLRNIVPRLERQGTRLIINNVVLPLPGDTSIDKRAEARARTRDLFMMQAMNGQERDIDQWKQLLADADPRLVIVGVRTPEGSGMSVLEVLLEQNHDSKTT
jgi:6-hydroxytryprostatin B O-methyltransferase